MSLLDEDTGVVDGLGQTELVDLGLETALQEILDLEGQDVIELHAGLVEHTNANKTANQGVTLEQALGVFLVKSEELTITRHNRISKASQCFIIIVVLGGIRPYRAARRILDKVS